MDKIKALCVYCGSSVPKHESHRAAADKLGEIMVENDIELVYGGARVGLMGMIADAVLSRGGRVIGIIPEHLQKYEVGHDGITELHIVENMHVRKMMMFERGDAFAILPGGYGTMDEMFEMLTWRQLKMHDKPLFLVDIDDYWKPLRALLDHIIEGGYARKQTAELLEIVTSVEEILPRLQNVKPPRFDAKKKWM